MKITKESDYGIRAVLFMSSRPPEKRVTLDELSREIFIPKSFLSKILQKLVAGGILDSRKGKKGGFQIVSPSADITCLDIIEMLEGPVNINDCISGNGSCSHSGTCVMTQIWVRLRLAFREILNDYTIERLEANGENCFPFTGQCGCK